MSEKATAGTFRLDGMLQGPLPSETIAVTDMEGWAASAKGQGLHFHFSADGASFSIVADPAAQKTSRLNDQDLGALLVAALEALLSFLPEDTRSSTFSTVRSEEFRPGIAIQTLYAVSPDGTIASEQRELQIETEDAPPEITPASLRRAALPALFTLVVVLLISSFFIDYRGMFSDARDRIAPLSKSEVVVDQSALSDFVKLELNAVDNKRQLLIFKLSRGPAWEKVTASTPQEALADWPTFLNHLAIHRGHIFVDLQNKKGRRLGTVEIPLVALEKKKSAEVAVAAKLSDRLAKIVAHP